jgi:recyclin-1
MDTYKASDHDSATSVAPLLQFFELVHVGDTIQSMVQVYFDKELVRLSSCVNGGSPEQHIHVLQAPHIDRTDFLNTVVREKKRFENALDDSVAAGLNAGTQVLMNQVRPTPSCTKMFLSPARHVKVEHIMLTLTKPREYYPPENAALDLGPTHGCTKAIQCLDVHCKLLKGSTSKEVLEVFYQEVGLRLIG